MIFFRSYLNYLKNMVPNVIKKPVLETSREDFGLKLICPSKVKNIDTKYTYVEENNQEEELTVWLFLKEKIKWKSVLYLIFVHVIGIYGLLTFPFVQHMKTTIYIQFIILFSLFGVMGGSHRLWSHRSYSAKLPLRILLATCFISASSVPISAWVQEHRVHHKFSETDADPHDSRRGFFYSHCGWMMVDRRPEVFEKYKVIDMTDVNSDPVVAFTDRYFKLLRPLTLIIITVIPIFCWAEDWHYAIIAQFIKLIIISHNTWSLNSFAHMWGYKPYDKNIASTDNSLVQTLTYGEGSHNYHHTFPSDYRTPDLPYGFDLTTFLIHMFASIGWAYNLKQSSESLIQNTINKRGDRSLLKSRF